jgi:hypothetical protein
MQGGSLLPEDKMTEPDKEPEMAMSRKGLGGLPEKDLTRLSFYHNLRILIFLLVGAIIFSFAATILGTAGKIIGWIGIVICCLFSLEPASGFFHALVSLTKSRTDALWKLLRLTVHAISAALYILFALIIHANLG